MHLKSMEFVWFRLLLLIWLYYKYAVDFSLFSYVSMLHVLIWMRLLHFLGFMMVMEVRFKKVCQVNVRDEGQYSLLNNKCCDLIVSLILGFQVQALWLEASISFAKWVLCCASKFSLCFSGIYHYVLSFLLYFRFSLFWYTG